LPHLSSGRAAVMVVLSSAKIGTASWRYYADAVACRAADYYAGVGEAPGIWHGRGLEALGLAERAEVSVRVLEATFGRALHPDTGVQLGRAWRADGVTGFDLTFSAPKSVSALWALGDAGTASAAVAAHRAAVKAGLGVDPLSRTPRDCGPGLGRSGSCSVLLLVASG